LLQGGKAMAVRVTAKITSKGQASIPAQVRRALNLRPGDSMLFLIDDGEVRVSRAEPIDAAFLRLSSESFSDWDAPEADEAFRDL
jgi:AbrB family looped-hinge helix DNA binding protein